MMMMPLDNHNCVDSSSEFLGCGSEKVTTHSLKIHRVMQHHALPYATHA